MPQKAPFLRKKHSKTRDLNPTDQNVPSAVPLYVLTVPMPQISDDANR